MSGLWRHSAMFLLRGATCPQGDLRSFAKSSAFESGQLRRPDLNPRERSELKHASEASQIPPEKRNSPAEAGLSGLGLMVRRRPESRIGARVARRQDEAVSAAIRRVDADKANRDAVRLEARRIRLTQPRPRWDLNPRERSEPNPTRKAKQPRLSGAVQRGRGGI